MAPASSAPSVSGGTGTPGLHAPNTGTLPGRKVATLNTLSLPFPGATR